jgi:hypothetical protein
MFEKMWDNVICSTTCRDVAVKRIGPLSMVEKSNGGKPFTMRDKSNFGSTRLFPGSNDVELIRSSRKWKERSPFLVLGKQDAKRMTRHLFSWKKTPESSTIFLVPDWNFGSELQRNHPQ